MKPNPALNARSVLMDIPSANTGKVRYLHPKKIKKQKEVPPSVDENFARLNAMAKEYPFCFHYKGKDHDTL